MSPADRDFEDKNLECELEKTTSMMSGSGKNLDIKGRLWGDLSSDSEDEFIDATFDRSMSLNEPSAAVKDSATGSVYNSFTTNTNSSGKGNSPRQQPKGKGKGNKKGGDNLSRQNSSRQQGSNQHQRSRESGDRRPRRDGKGEGKDGKGGKNGARARGERIQREDSANMAGRATTQSKRKNRAVEISDEEEWGSTVNGGSINLPQAPKSDVKQLVSQTTFSAICLVSDSDDESDGTNDGRRTNAPYVESEEEEESDEESEEEEVQQAPLASVREDPEEEEEQKPEEKAAAPVAKKGKKPKKEDEDLDALLAELDAPVPTGSKISVTSNTSEPKSKADDAGEGGENATKNAKKKAQKKKAAAAKVEVKESEEEEEEKPRVLLNPADVLKAKKAAMAGKKKK